MDSHVERLIAEAVARRMPSEHYRLVLFGSRARGGGNDPIGLRRGYPGRATG